MSYRTASWQDLWEGTGTGVFSQGYVDNTPNLYIPQWASPYLRNARLDGNTIEIRKGHTLFKDIESLEAWWAVASKGIWSYLRPNDLSSRLIVRENYDADKKIVLYDEDGTATPVTTWANITSDNRMCFINIADTVYCMNGSDKLGKLTGSTYTVDTSKIPTNFAPAFWVVFNGCQRLSWWSTNPNVVYKSLGWIYDNTGQFQVPAYYNFTDTGSDQFTFEENVTGLCANAQALFYFTKNTISVTGSNDYETVQIGSSGWSRIAYRTAVLTAKEWAVNHYWIVWVWNDVYYITPSNKICKIVRGNNIYGYEVQDLSGRKYAGCEGLMRTLAKDQSQCFGYYVPKEDIIKWFFKTEGSDIHDICVVYDIEKDKFLVDTGKPFSWGVAFKGKVYTISEVEPKIFIDENGSEDEDAPIPFEYWTKEFYVSDPSFKKIFWETRTTIDINLNTELIQEIWVDGRKVDSVVINKSWLKDNAVWWIATFATGTSMVWVDIEADTYTEELDTNELYILRTKWNLNVRGHKIQFRFSNTTEWAKLRLKYLSLRSEVLPELTNGLR